jgi:hypothetical protein
LFFHIAYSFSSHGAYKAFLVRAEQSLLVPNQYIVVFKTPPDSPILSNFLREYGAQWSTMITHNILNTFDGRINLIHRYSFGFSAEFSEDCLEKVLSLPYVDFVEENFIVSVANTYKTPNSNQSEASWGLSRISSRLGNSLDYTYPSSSGENVDVYVIDTGGILDFPNFSLY